MVSCQLTTMWAPSVSMRDASPLAPSICRDEAEGENLELSCGLGCWFPPSSTKAPKVSPIKGVLYLPRFVAVTRQQFIEPLRRVALRALFHEAETYTRATTLSTSYSVDSAPLLR